VRESTKLSPLASRFDTNFPWGFLRLSCSYFAATGWEGRRGEDWRGGSVKIESHSLKIKWTLRGSFSSVSTPILASEYSLENSWRDLQDVPAFENVVNVFVRFQHWKWKKNIFSDLKFVAIFADFNEICSDLIFSDFLENAEKRCNLNSRNFSISIWFSSWLYRRFIWFSTEFSI